MTAARRVRVRGRVQGVFYRAWTRQQAEDLGLSGWVSNCADGSVEVFAEGSAESVATLIGRLHEGPPAALVEAVSTEETEPQALSGFEVRR